MITQGDVWWADLDAPYGSEPGFRRPVVVVQGDAFNRSALATAVCLPLTSDVSLAAVPGNLALPATATGLPKDAVALVAQPVTLDRSRLAERVGRVSPPAVELLLRGVLLVLGR